MVQINEVNPPTFRAGDQVTIDGFGFSPVFGRNGVLVELTEAVIESESATQIVITVPVGVTVNAFVALSVQRTDTGDFDVVTAFSGPSIADLADGNSDPTAQLPGPYEFANPAFLPDVPQAQDFERFMAVVTYLLRELLLAKGDLFASDGVSPMQAFAVGAAGQVLQANPGQPVGLEWIAPAQRSITHSWSQVIDAPGTLNGDMVAGGDGTIASNSIGEHLAGDAGNVTQVVVLVESAGGGDTLDRVTLLQNGGIIYDSLTGLGLVQGQALIANTIPLAVGANDLLVLQAFKAGVAQPMTLRGKVRIN